jgi:hypothetical protein
MYLILVIYWKKTGLLITKLATIILFIDHRNAENRRHCHYNHNHDKDVV